MCPGRGGRGGRSPRGWGIAGGGAPRVWGVAGGGAPRVWGPSPPRITVKRDTESRIELESEHGLRYRECTNSYEFILNSRIR